MLLDIGTFAKFLLAVLSLLKGIACDAMNYHREITDRSLELPVTFAIYSGPVPSLKELAARSIIRNDIAYKEVLNKCADMIKADMIKLVDGQISALETLNCRLMGAIRRGDVTGVKVFLARGADVTAYYQGETMLMWAARSVIRDGKSTTTTDNYKKIVKILVAAGADINALCKCKYGTPVLVFAAGGGSLAMVESFLDVQANVNLQDMSGNTALIKAAETGHGEIVKVLLAAHARIDLQNNQGHTACDLAQLCRYDDVVKLIDNFYASSSH